MASLALLGVWVSVLSSVEVRSGRVLGGSGLGLRGLRA